MSRPSTVTLVAHTSRISSRSYSVARRFLSMSRHCFLGARTARRHLGGRVLAAVTVEAQARRGTHAATLDRTHTHHLGVDGARHTVRELDVELRQDVLCLVSHFPRIGVHTIVHTSLAQVTQSGSLDNVADSEALDGLVLRHSPRAVRATHKPNVATSVLVASVLVSPPLCAAAHIPSISSLLRHLASGDGGTEEGRWYRRMYLTAPTHVNCITCIIVLTTPFVHGGDTTRGGSWLRRDARLHSCRARHSCPTSCRVDHGLCASAQVASAQ